MKGFGTFAIRVLALLAIAFAPSPFVNIFAAVVLAATWKD